MRLWAISDLHVGHEANRRALLELPPHPGDWLAVVGDVGETGLKRTAVGETKKIHGLRDHLPPAFGQRIFRASRLLDGKRRRSMVSSIGSRSWTRTTGRGSAR